MNAGKLFRHFAEPMFALALAGGLTAVGSQFASAQGITVSTPAFSVDSQLSPTGTYQYPTGTYQFTLISDSLLSILNVKSGKKNIFLIRPEVNGPQGVHGGVVFNNSRGQRSLKAVYIPGTDMAAELVGNDLARAGEKEHARWTSTTSHPNTVALGKREPTGQ